MSDDTKHIRALSHDASLAEVVGATKTINERVHKDLTAAYHRFGKPDLFDGFARTYQPSTEGGDQLPPEGKLVQEDALRLLDLVRDSISFKLDNDCRRESANTHARADIIVGGNVLAAGVPVTLLMPLEKEIRNLQAELEKAPVLNPGSSWTWSPTAERWESAAEQQNRTKKEPRVITKVVQDEHHPGQAEVIYEDRPVGVYTSTKYSTALSAARKRQLVLRAAALADAVKAAIERANKITAPPNPIGAALMDYIFAG